MKCWGGGGWRGNRLLTSSCHGPACPGHDKLWEQLHVLVRPEAHDNLALQLQHRALYHRGLRQHQSDGFFPGQPVLVGVGQLFECRSGAVEQRFPARLFYPAFQPRLVDALLLIVVEGVFDLVAVEPGARLLHRIAVGNAVDLDHQYTTTERIDLPSCIKSKPLLISSSVRTCVIMGSMAILPSMYQSTIFGTSVRPLAPPKAEPFQTRPVTSWNGRVAISLPASATPMMIDWPQPRWQASSAWR